jgi:hypothetical protein
MDVGTVLIEGHHEALALHRFLFEYKGEDISSVYAGSPFLAAIQNRLADALEAADPGTGWTEWRAAAQHTHRVDAVRRHLASADGWWNAMSREQRDAHVRDLLAPLRVSDDLLGELVDVRGEPNRPSDGEADIP